MKYVIINEKFEVKNPDSLIKDAFDQGLMNGEYTVEYECNDIDTVKEAISCYDCETKKVNSGSTVYYILNMYYYAEINDNGEYTGNYGAADLVKRYQVVNADTHEVYDAFNTKEDAYFCIDAYETFDKKHGEYVENLYEVYDTVREIHV